jgi:hypothetical protein
MHYNPLVEYKTSIPSFFIPLTDYWDEDDAAFLHEDAMIIDYSLICVTWQGFLYKLELFTN